MNFSMFNSVYRAQRLPIIFIKHVILVSVMCTPLVEYKFFVVPLRERFFFSFFFKKMKLDV